MNTPTTSVVMTVYNGEKYLREAVDSILNQTFEDFEFIIVDDASTDETWKILNNYSDRRIRLLRNSRNLRQTLSANRGISVARGQYIARQDADDISLPDRFSEQVLFFKKHPEIGFVGTNYCLIDYNGRKLDDVHLPSTPETVERTIFEWNCTCNGSIMFPRRHLEHINPYRPQFDQSEDYDFLLRLTELNGGTNLPQCLYLHRYHVDSLSITSLTRQVSRAKLARELSRDRRLFGSESIELSTMNADDLDRLYPPEPQQLARRQLHQAYLSYLSNDHHTAKRQFNSALLSDPALISDQQKLYNWLLAHTIKIAGKLSSKEVGLDFLRTLLASDRENNIGLDRLRRRVEAEFHLAVAFESRDLQNKSLVRAHLAAALRNDPTWLRNRGVLSLARWSLFSRENKNREKIKADF
jgi:glycosyltransferase involved in cell wall biosynthesis